MSGKINKARRVFFCTTAQPTDLNQAAFEALTYVEVSNVVTVGATGANSNVVSQDYWGTDVTQKQVGVTNAGDPELEVGRDLSDVGQNAMRLVGNDGNNYAFKFEDPLLAGETTPVTYYNRGMVLGPVTNNGAVEDWSNHVFTLALNQLQVVVDAT